MSPPDETADPHGHTAYCCVLHTTDASLHGCMRKHAFKDDYSLSAYAIFVQAEADEKRRKKTYKPTEHGA